ncbi:loricrin-like [Schistocerca americana]|uniref:loricrin-like n=1 Tax=Schistocerca americana TaxID=7009 RepID=UPI001F4F509A|nr:loricrin-like [Schistocerca americana]
MRHVADTGALVRGRGWAWWAGAGEGCGGVQPPAMRLTRGCGLPAQQQQQQQQQGVQRRRGARKCRVFGRCGGGGCGGGGRHVASGGQGREGAAAALSRLARRGGGGAGGGGGESMAGATRGAAFGSRHPWLQEAGFALTPAEDDECRHVTFHGGGGLCPAADIGYLPLLEV